MSFRLSRLDGFAIYIFFVVSAHSWLVLASCDRRRTDFVFANCRVPFIGRVRLFWLAGVGCSGAAKIVNSPLSAPSPQSVGDGTMSFAIPYGLSFVPAGAVFSQKEK